MPKLKINGQEIEVEDGLTVIQACEQLGIEIPRFCYHEKLSIAGNCRMCLVEVEKAPKPVASCAMPIAEGMIVHTDTEKVRKAREGVMEFLLINHPLDCPICDQGGECDLQDQAMTYGRGTNRFDENKRSVKDKYMGPLVKTHMTRCIQCTRCIRFATEVAGIEEIGAIGRGEHMEVTTYVEKTLQSELSGNIIDICPVGALTSKPYAFKARSWELKKTESIDVLDAVGSNIRIDTRGLEVMRILPKVNEDINEEWISDKTRFAYDGLKYQRLDRPYIRENGRLRPASWNEALELAAKKLGSTEGSRIAAIAGTLADTETLFALKLLFEKLGSKNLDANQFGYRFDLAKRGNYLFNTTLAGINDADFCLLIGANPRQVAPTLNARIKGTTRRGLKVARIGEVDNQTYPVIELGESPTILNEILAGKHELSKILAKSKNPMFIIGDAVLTRSDSVTIQETVYQICQKYNAIRSDWNGFNILHNHASMVGALDIGFYPTGQLKSTAGFLTAIEAGKIDVVYLYGADEIDPKKLGNTFVIYQGHHGDRSANRADLILPGAAYTEKNAIYVNLEGRAQKARSALFPPGEAREDYVIVKQIAEILSYDLGFNNLPELRALMTEAVNSLKDIDKVSSNDISFGEIDGEIADKPLKKIKFNFYMTDPISRSSKTMAKCSQEILKKEEAA
ncbi:MAG: nqo3 [Rickettsiaceae bacterium]|jgi:NADH-quinone oxidoreductase subunit G|nr:nqo3 [Rickettsiaceae bacterium]